MTVAMLIEELKKENQEAVVGVGHLQITWYVEGIEGTRHGFINGLPVVVLCIEEESLNAEEMNLRGFLESQPGPKCR